MAKEIIDELNELGEIIGQIDKDLAHKEGKLHKSIHLWIMNDNNEVLLQYRCSDKDLYPDTWDISVGGHVGSLEDTKSAAIREAKEELGIDVDTDALEFITTLREDLLYNDIDSREFVDVYLLRKNFGIDEFNLQKEEVGSTKFVSIPELFRLMDEELLLPHYEEYKLMKNLFTDLANSLSPDSLISSSWNTNENALTLAKVGFSEILFAETLNNSRNSSDQLIFSELVLSKCFADNLFVIGSSLSFH